MTRHPSIAVVGSINVDLMCRCLRLPRAGETVLGGEIERLPGGKGANQAVAAARLGAAVRMVGAVGDDGAGEEMLQALAGASVDIASVRTVKGPTGMALVVVDEIGENQIVVSPGANAHVALEACDLSGVDAVLAQLEIPLAVVERAAEMTAGFFCLNAAPARDLPRSLIERSDLVIVNDSEHAALPGLHRARLLAVTHGAAGATLIANGKVIARASPPPVRAIDTVGAGDAFAAAITIRLAGGQSAAEALAYACAAGALATTQRGAQSAFPMSEEVAIWASRAS